MCNSRGFSSCVEAQLTVFGIWKAVIFFSLSIIMSRKMTGNEKFKIPGEVLQQLEETVTERVIKLLKKLLFRSVRKSLTKVFRVPKKKLWHCRKKLNILKIPWIPTAAI